MFTLSLNYQENKESKVSVLQAFVCVLNGLKIPGNQWKGEGTCVCRSPVCNSPGILEDVYPSNE